MRPVTTSAMSIGPPTRVPELLAVRLYREEVAPRIDLVLDISRSMAVTEQKLRAYGELVGAAGLRLRVHRRRLAHHHDVGRPTAAACTCPKTSSASSPATPALSALEEAHLPFRRRSLRVVVSDFLFPHDADALVSRLARDSALLAIVQLTLREEAEPVVEGGRRLVDVEGRGELDLVIDEAAVRDYRARFSRLRLGLSGAARRVGARFAHVVAGTPVRDVARGLAAAGVLEAA